MTPYHEFDEGTVANHLVADTSKREDITFLTILPFVVQ
jgi:hypothetical protein